MLLKAENLSKSFGELKAINNLSINIEEGGIVSIIGPNGAGKSTLVNLLTGLIKPSSGKIIFENRDITRTSIQYRARKGLNRSFQINSLFANMTVKENILLSLMHWELPKSRMLKNILPHHLEQRVISIAEDINMMDKINTEVDKLSHGDQRMIEIAISISRAPKLLFLDEPTSGLSPSERTTIIDKIKSIASNKTTVVLIEHNMDVIFSLARRIIVMHRGSVLADGEPQEIRANPEIRKIYLGEEVTVA